MKTIYINFKGSCGIETVDEFTIEPAQSWLAFNRYVNEMIREYRMSGMNVYRSSRPTRDWANR
jgi:hypothetical protein